MITNEFLFQEGYSSHQIIQPHGQTILSNYVLKSILAPKLRTMKNKCDVKSLERVIIPLELLCGYSHPNLPN